MTKHKLLYTRDAVDDLDSIFDYISEKNQVAAINMLEEIEGSIVCLIHYNFRAHFHTPYSLFFYCTCFIKIFALCYLFVISTFFSFCRYPINWNLSFPIVKLHIYVDMCAYFFVGEGYNRLHVP